MARLFLLEQRLEREAELPRNCPRRHIVRAAEGREEVVERVFIRHVYRRNTRTPSEAVTMEEVVIAHCHVEQAARLDARRILVIVLGPRRRNGHELRGEPVRIALAES